MNDDKLLKENILLKEDIRKILIEINNIKLENNFLNEIFLKIDNIILKEIGIIKKETNIIIKNFDIIDNYIK